MHVLNPVIGGSAKSSDSLRLVCSIGDQLLMKDTVKLIPFVFIVPQKNTSQAWLDAIFL